MWDEGTCPTEDILLRFVNGGLDRQNRLHLIDHVGACERCGRLVDELTDRTSALDDEVTATQQLSPHDLSITADADALEEDTHAGLSFGERFSPTDNPAAIGRVGDYDIIGPLGHGGMGIVYAAMDRTLRRPVAIKFLVPELAANAESCARFLREARSAAAINHPNVVTIHAVAEHCGTPFLVMELIGGPTLRERIRESGPLPADVVAYIGAQVAMGLAAAHAQGVVHRDIKPGNVMLKGDMYDVVKITDFGLAFLGVDSSKLTDAEIRIGTPAYMSPEQAQGGVVDYRSDLFSLGCVLYAMICGRSPFHGSNSFHSATMVVGFAPPPPETISEQCPPRLSQVVMRLMDKDPAARYASAEEVAKELSQLVEDADALAAVATPRRVWSLEQRLAGVVSAVLCVAAAVIALAVDPGIFKISHEKARDVIVVAAEGGDLSTVRQALLASQPNTTIRVKTDVIRQRIIIDDAKRYSGVTIEFGDAVWEGPGEVAVVINGVPDVTLRGLRMKLSAEQHGVQITGVVPGLTIEGLRVEQPPESEKAAIFLHNETRGEPDRPITLRRLEVHLADMGVILLNTAKEAMDHIVIEDCRFHGPEKGEGVGLIFNGTIRRAMVRRCLFFNCRSGVNFVAKERMQLDEVSVEDSVFFNAQFWMGALEGTSPEQRVRVRGNRILQVHSTEIKPDRPLSDYSHWFEDNLWETPPSLEEERAAHVAEVVEKLNVHSRDPADERFLEDADESGGETSKTR